MTIRKYHQPKKSKLISLFLVGIVSQCLLNAYIPNRSLAQTAPAAASACTQISTPLTPEEQAYAKTAWQYFVNNYQPATGLTNSTGGYPSGTLWDIGNYLMALNAARWLNLINQGEFDSRLNQFLKTLGGLKLFEDALPNKVYNAATGQMTDYGNNPLERGIGWSALDAGRLMAALHVIRTCHPQYADWIKGILAKWQIARSVKDDHLYGATIAPDKKTMLVQEGRLGYEEYAARGYELWGFKALKALALEPYKFIEVNGVRIPVDTRDYKSTQANNYVVSESYILDGIEFGLEGYLKEYAASVLEVQKRRFEATGQLTAVSEDNIDQAPYFLYNTVYANGVSWATITDENKPYPQLRSISTKAAFGWRYLYPDNPYAQKVFDAVKDLRSPDGGGFYAGLYEETKQPNKALTGNTNGLILEILYYKARGNRPLIGPSLVTFAQPNGNAASVEQSQPSVPSSSAPATSATGTPTPTASAPSSNDSTAVVVKPIPSAGNPDSSVLPKLTRSLTQTERRYAQAAWQYFEANYQPSTGLVSDRQDLKGATLWGLGDYLAALHAARSLDIISPQEFDQRTRHLLAALAKLPLFAGELPQRGYDIRTLQPVDYGGNSVPEGTGWSGLDVGRMLAALYNLKTWHPEYTDAVDRIVMDWSYLRVVRDGIISSATVEKDKNERVSPTGLAATVPQVLPETRLGFEEYAARGFQLWGFSVERSAVGGRYKTASVEGMEIPIQRIRPDANSSVNQYTVTDPFLLYGLEFGFDPQMRAIAEPLLRAQAERYRRTGKFTASGTTVIDIPPYVVHSSIIGGGEPWSTLAPDGRTAPDARTVSTAVAFAHHALFPNDAYARDLWQATTDLYNPSIGFYEGFYEKTGKSVTAFTASTNSMVLQSLLYLVTDRQPLIRPSTAMNSPWWRSVKKGDSGRGLPVAATQKAKFVSDASGTYWTTGSDNPTPVTLERGAEVQGSGGAGESPVQPSTLAKPATPPTQPAQAPHLPLSPSPSLPISPNSPRLTREVDQIAAQRAWQYFERNWNSRTGLVNSGDGFPWTTLWDQGSAILGIHAAHQLGVIGKDRFNSMIGRLLQTLETLPLPATGLPNKAYSAANAQMRRLDNTLDPKGTSGWSALDTARLLLGLHVLRTHYPEYGERINSLVARWDLPKLAKDGWLYGGIPGANGQIKTVQEGRLGYEQYAARSLKLWNLEATNALSNPPVNTVRVDGIALQVDERNLNNSGASNYLTSEPYVLWGLELGWPDSVKPQVESLFKVQAQRFQRTGILTAVNEDSLDRPPYFLYYNVYANGQPWQPINTKGQAYPQLRFLSTKAAFSWFALMPDDPYTKKLRDFVQNLFEQNRGYISGKYENSQLGVNKSLDVNTNAVILESLLYQARGGRPLAF